MEVALKNLTVEGVVSILQQRLIDDVDEDDPSRATTVRAGKLQQDPTKGTGINVLVWPEDEPKPDILFTRHAQRDSGIHMPSNEIGGGHYFYRRYRIYLLFHFRGYRGEDGRTDARQISQVIQARIVHLLLSKTVDEYIQHPTSFAPSDDFNETAIDVQVDDMWLRESGGDGHFIWKGEIAFGYGTEHLARSFLTP
jgi:hypothetical protein